MIGIVVRFGLALNRSMRCHGECDHDIDLVRLHLLGDPPAPWRLYCDRSTHRKPDVWVRIGEQILAANQFKQILRDCGQIARRLRKLPHLKPGSAKPLCSRLHLERIEQDLAKQKALAQVEHRSFDRRFEIQRLVGAWLKNAMRNEANLLRRSGPTWSQRWPCCRA